MLLLVLYERCSDAVSDDNPVKPPKKSCGRIMLGNPINILILSILIPRFFFFFLHFVEWGPGNTWHKRCVRDRENINIAFLSKLFMPCHGTSWIYSCLSLIFISIIVDKIPECGVILKTRPGTITYKNESNQHHWHQGPNFIHLAARAEFGWISFCSAPKDATDPWWHTATSSGSAPQMM